MKIGEKTVFFSDLQVPTIQPRSAMVVSHGDIPGLRRGGYWWWDPVSETQKGHPREVVKRGPKGYPKPTDLTTSTT